MCQLFETHFVCWQEFQKGLSKKKQFYKSQPKNAFFEGVPGVPGVPTAQTFG
jgi:hypothetical protein